MTTRAVVHTLQIFSLDTECGLAVLVKVDNTLFCLTCSLLWPQVNRDPKCREMIYGTVRQN